MPYTRIVVPLDGSRLAESALPIAWALAARSHAEVLLLRVIDESPAVDASARRSPGLTAGAVLSGGRVQSTGAPVAMGAGRPGGPQSGTGEARKYLDTTAAGLASAGAPVAVETACGEPSEAILRIAGREQADLIVMATHGRSGLARSVLGSVTDSVALHSSVPVLVVRPAPGTADTGTARTIVRWVLVPLDQSELSESALPHACAIAAAFGARLRLLTVIPPSAEPSQDDVVERYHEAVSARLGMPASQVDTRVTRGDARSEIAGQLELLHDAMVVMTTRGASGLRRWLRGSVTDAVIRSALAPTMVVPPVAPLLGPAIH
jgi:nucleotide-binding universal stress UspA family protein